jgi:hypothetical protein
LSRIGPLLRSAIARSIAVRRNSAFSRRSRRNSSRTVADVRRRALSEIIGPVSDAEIARIVGPIFFQRFIARRDVDDAFLSELLEALAPRDHNKPT